MRTPAISGGTDWESYHRNDAADGEVTQPYRFWNRPLPRRRASSRLNREERILAAEAELANLRSWEARRELALRQVASAEAIVAGLRAQLADADFNTRQTILRLVVEKVVVTAQRLEIHLALPVSSRCDLSYVWGARRREIRKQTLPHEISSLFAKSVRRVAT